MPFEGPIVVDPDLAALKATQRSREVRCSCEGGPFCRGPLSHDWLDCSTSCRACKPPPWQPPVTGSVQAGSGGLDAE
jgi:hypothetical protein